MLVAGAAAVHAGTERFDYDALARLVRHIDSSGTITEYAYDTTRSATSWKCVARPTAGRRA